MVARQDRQADYVDVLVRRCGDLFRGLPDALVDDFEAGVTAAAAICSPLLWPSSRAGDQQAGRAVMSGRQGQQTAAGPGRGRGGRGQSRWMQVGPALRGLRLSVRRPLGGRALPRSPVLRLGGGRPARWAPGTPPPHLPERPAADSPAVLLARARLGCLPSSGWRKARWPPHPGATCRVRR